MTDARIIFTAGLSIAASSLVTGAPFDTECVLLEIFILITSLSVSGVPLLQFNGDTGTTNYAWSLQSNAGSVSSAASGTANGIQLGTANATTGFGSKLLVGNGPSSHHAVMIEGIAGALDASAAPAIITGAGVWANTTQINSIQLSSPQGGNLGAGSGIMVVAYVP